MQGTMRAMAKMSPSPGAELIEVPIPRPGKGEVLIKVRATAICGTDVHIYEWDKWAQDRIRTPRIFGHEFCGDVVEVGPGVERIKPGQFVSIETHTACGHCFFCQTGEAHICADAKIVGVDIDGCFAEYVVMPEFNCWIWDIDIPDEIAAIQDPLGNAVHTAFATSLSAKTVLITGMGPIGLCAIKVAKAAGATAVFVTDVSDYRLDLARKLGADLAINPKVEDPVAAVRAATDGLGADVLLEMAGNPAAITQGLRSLRKAGFASLLGIPSAPMEIDLAKDVIFRSLTLQGINGRRMFDTWYKSRALLKAGLDVSPVITHKFSLWEGFHKGMELMMAGKCGKVILIP
ncbi:MAG: L-threonine 3-dehydrogenase [Firmicutes bacterium ADurb.Bin506]|jgi:threonine 3-dehydrogenase|nr:MAG: L-threonine 3-dehydrogenase [Firmicutes bacterium ADurb.Bin506]